MKKSMVNFFLGGILMRLLGFMWMALVACSVSFLLIFCLEIFRVTEKYDQTCSADAKYQWEVYVPIRKAYCFLFKPVHKGEDGEDLRYRIVPLQKGIMCEDDGTCRITTSPGEPE